MKTTTYIRLLARLLLVILGIGATAFGQLTAGQDAYTDTAKPTTNFGTASTLGVTNTAGSIQTSYIQFDLSSIPAGYTGANLAKATLKLYVNALTTAGNFNVDFVNGSWSENKITANMAPALGGTIVASVPLTNANKQSYINVDVTSALAAWLNGSQANNGIALVANSQLSASFDSNENTAQSHPAELDVVFNGAITGINTASGSGLTGGGTSGTLNLSLLKSCSSNQVLQWNVSSWVCSNAGTGTITAVTAGTDLTGGGNGGNVTLNLDRTKVPQLNTNNSFSGNQSVTGNVSVGAGVSGATGSFSQSSGNPTLKVTNSGGGDGIDISTSGTGITITGSNNGFIAKSALQAVTGTGTGGWGGYFVGSDAGTYSENDNDMDYRMAAQGSEFGLTKKTIGVYGSTASPNGTGVYGQIVSASAVSSGVGQAGVWGDSKDYIGVQGTSDNGPAAQFVNNVSNGATLYVQNKTSSPNSLLISAYDFTLGKGCNIDVSGNLTCSGSKSAVVPVDNGSRKVALYAVEAPENWFEDFGSGHLVDGSAVVNLEPVFAQTVNTDMDYHVFLTPRGDCEGLYIANATAGSFEVRELHHGLSRVAFDYRIVARRKGYEDIRLADKTKMFDMSGLKQVDKSETRPPTGQEIRDRNRQKLMNPLTQLRKSTR
jgi:hypothetical protein